MLSKNDLLDDYQDLLSAISKEVKAEKFQEAIKLIELTAKIEYHFPITDSFADEKLEDWLSQIARKCLPSVTIIPTGKVLFYDYFCYDNRGLTQQYIRALMEMDKEIVYLLEVALQEPSKSEILAELRAYPKATIYILEPGDALDKSAQVVRILAEENPGHALLHLAPWDVVALLAFKACQGIVKYQINLTDHALWLGKQITDICIEFRAFGYNLSHKKRHFGKGQLRILPYYPITNKCSFEGLPQNAKGKKIILSGGSVYKILGLDLVFLRLVQKLLMVDPELIFIYAGSGNTTAIEHFIQINNLEERFFLVGDRKDINALMHHVHYYLSTFPFTGGLMTQIAAAAGVPVFTYNSKEGLCNEMGDLYYKMDGLKCHNTIDGLVEEFKLVYRDSDWLKAYGSRLAQASIKPGEMTAGLASIMKGDNPFAFLEKDYDISAHRNFMFDFLIESDNYYVPVYQQMVTREVYKSRDRKQYLPHFYRREQRYNWKANKVQYFKNCLKQYLNK